MTHHYIAREWACHAATSVGYEEHGRFTQIAECSGFGHSSAEAAASAAQIVTALNCRQEIDRRLGDASTRLHNICEALSEERDGSEFSREEWERIDAENSQLRADATAMAMRLYGERPDTFAPETAEVMARWRPIVEAVLAGSKA